MNLWEQRTPPAKHRRGRLRAAVAAAVAAVVLVPSAVYASHSFSDVPNIHPFHSQISWMAATGITTGCTGSTYCPNDPVTRAQMAVFMQRLYNTQAGLTGTAHGSNGGDNGSTIDAWIDAGISASVTIPPGTTARLMATVSGEILCNSGDNTLVVIIVFRPSCKVRLVRGSNAVMNPAEAVVAQSLDAQNDGDLAIDMTGFSFSANSGTTPLGPGTHTVKVQIMADDADTNNNDKLVADLGDYHLRVDAVPVKAT